MGDYKTCYSLNKRTNKRCANETFGTSNHCVEHRKRALELYLVYKRLCDKVDNLNIDKYFSDRRAKLRHLKKCISLLIKAYDARMKHRNEALSPEVYDDGHNLQFKIIQDKIELCRKELDTIRPSVSETFEECDSTLGAEVKDDGKMEENLKTCSACDDKLKKFKKRQAEDEEETRRILDKYIEENKAEYSIVNEYKNKITNLFKNLTKISDPNFLFVVYSTFVSLTSTKYFNVKVGTRIHSGSDKNILLCGSFDLKDEYSNLDIRLGHYSPTNIKKMYLYLLLNLKKFKFISDDYVKLYKVFGDDIYKRFFHIKWMTKRRRYGFCDGHLYNLKGIKLSKKHLDIILRDQNCDQDESKIILEEKPTVIKREQNGATLLIDGCEMTISCDPYKHHEYDYSKCEVGDILPGGYRIIKKGNKCLPFFDYPEQQ